MAEFLGHCNILPARVLDRQDDVATVRLHDTQLVLTLTAPGALADEVAILVRPEAIILSEQDQPPGSPNTYQAKVASVAFLGDHYAYELDLSGLPLSVTDTRRCTSPELAVHIPVPAGRALGA